MISRLRAIMLGCLVLLAMGSFAASAAYGEAGPFWHHRSEPKGEGAKIEENAQETIVGGGGTQTLNGRITLGPEKFELVEISSTQLQVKGNIWNNGLQAQAKVHLIYVNPALIKPNLSGCVVKVGQANNVDLHGTVDWKWDGTGAQLLESPQKGQNVEVVLTPVQIQQGAKELPKAQFTTVTLAGLSCGVLAGTYKVEGSALAEFEKSTLQEWHKSIALKLTKGVGLQHDWNGTAFFGAETGLTFGGNAAEYKGESKLETPQQEVAVFEK